ncbi:YopX family protein [Bacillus cereus]|uniref:YopX family protein n=1 Tax=Bacillus cereus TaxID=1396 RepID=UPI0015CF3F62|nr:YopX family protein [Bacillus cereus]
MKEIRYQVYTKDWTGVTKLFDLNALHCTKEGRDGLKVIFYNSAEAIESQIVGKDKIRQYTGIKDKNGIRIYEGDIVRHEEFKEDSEISYLAKEMCFIGIPINKEYRNDYFNGDVYFTDLMIENLEIQKCEVIGNKFENPELLKGANENE